MVLIDSSIFYVKNDQLYIGPSGHHTTMTHMQNLNLYMICINTWWSNYPQVESRLNFTKNVVIATQLLFYNIL